MKMAIGGKRILLKRTLGLTILTVLLAAPFLLMSRPAEAGRPSQDEICYTGKIRGRLGILIQVDDSRLREVLLRSHLASEFYGETNRQFRGYDVCIPLFRREAD